MWCRVFKFLCFYAQSVGVQFTAFCSAVITACDGRSVRCENSGKRAVLPKIRGGNTFVIIVILWRVSVVSTMALSSYGDSVVDLVLRLPLLSRCRGPFLDLVPIRSSVKSELSRPCPRLV